MQQTLYQKLIDVEKLNDIIHDNFINFEKNMQRFQTYSHSEYLESRETVDIKEPQKEILKLYENNSVIKNAIKGTQSITELLGELTIGNKGIRKFLPRSKNSERNQTIKHLGKLITEPDQLKSKGTWHADNIFTTGIYITSITYTIAYLVTLLTPSLYTNPEPGLLVKQARQTMDLLPLIQTAVLTPIIGSFMNMDRFNELPTDQAKYIDNKIQEFYK